ncbi:MAG TPA: methylthioribulose 1-phosphate dehydratase [Pseudomonadales bacterium]|nr:methylthioribulose 1-phosphate dehydratase [Pseudomonadales bacterium]
MSLYAQYPQYIDALIDAGRFLFGQGWCPATSSNYSMLLPDQSVLITVSGKHKGRLTTNDFLRVDLTGKPVQTDLRPSAETLLHTQLYGWKSDIKVVLHTHSVNATVLTRATESQQLAFSGYEMQKAFPGISTHESTVVLPIFENSQDIAALAEEVHSYLNANPSTPAYFIRGHGMYTWGTDMDSCLRHVEATEFLVACELEVRRLSVK